jgi:hypothetical protein
MLSGWNPAQQKKLDQPDRDKKHCAYRILGHGQKKCEQRPAGQTDQQRSYREPDCRV